MSPTIPAPSLQVRQGGLITGTSLDNALIPKPKIPGGDLSGLIHEDAGKVPSDEFACCLHATCFTPCRDA